MTACRLTFDTAAGLTFADTATRQISGVAIPAGATAQKGGRTWRFAKDSVKFGERTPLLLHHDVMRPVGKLTAGQWSDDGLRVTFSVSKTSAGDEALQLAADGVLALSVGVDVPEGGARMVGEELHVSDALASEVSLTPLPAFAGSHITSVALAADANEGTAPVPDCNTTPGAVPPVTVNLDAAALGTAIGTAMKPPATMEGPTPQPVPQTAVTMTREELPYRFDGRGGKHGFVADAVASSQGDGEATSRLNTFLHEVFVQRSDVTPLTPVQNRPDMFVGPLRYDRPLAGLVSTGSIADNTPFTVPKFGSTSNLVNPHVEGVEPTLANYSATSMTVTPGALSGKAELTRELWDARGNPQIDAIVWQEMLAASAEAAEERIANLLDAMTLTPVAIVGQDSSVVGGLTAELVRLQYTRGGNRYSSLALHEELYTGLVQAMDGDQRPMLPILGPTNATGTTEANFGAVRIGNATGVPAWGLNQYSYLLVPGSVWQWTSPAQRLTFDIQVKSVYIGLFQYSAEAVIRTSDVRRISYTP
jgi:hypothetical protein